MTRAPIGRTRSPLRVIVADESCPARQGRSLAEALISVGCVDAVDPDGLGEQLAYYRAIASRYDDAATRWFESQRPVFEAALDAFSPTGAVVEFAAGTGQWTVELARYASSLTVLDAAPEMLAVNQSKLAGASIPVSFVQCDVFEWRPDRAYDVVFFSLWLSHVPPGRFESFWGLVRRALRPGGRVFLIDETSPPVEGTGYEELVGARGRADDRAAWREARRLDDEQYSVVKIYWDPDELRDRLLPMGFDVTVELPEGAHYFYCQGGLR
jgi:ubiquinone/menaquinone biosynthesis C-methylase UbiE